MTRDPLAAFAGMKAPSTDGEEQPDTQPVNYPGSKKKRKAVVRSEDPWDNVPHLVLKVRGEERVFYSIGVLSQFLNRKPPAIRKWERLGYLPVSQWRKAGRGEHGTKRVYTREQIEGLVALAQEEGLLDTQRNVSSTKFPERAAALFRRLA